MHNPFAPILDAHGVVVIDGALATELERRGADLRDALWSARLLIDAPELIRAVHLDYLRAGADVLITASYQASIEGFQRRGLNEAQVATLFRLSVQLAAEAIEEYLAAFPARRKPRRPRPCSVRRAPASRSAPRRSSSCRRAGCTCAAPLRRCCS